ncbi:MAG: transposase [Anaerolineales bacterium]|nr:transposase [Anaerolineales bacterium]
MTSPSPLLYDTYYHIYNRGVNRENIFIEERNYAHFLNLFAKHIEPVCDLFGYCMLRNHFHMLVRVKSEEEIVEYKKTLDKETLRVSSVNSRQGGQGSLANQDEGQARKPLGSGYVSDQFSNFFNAYAKAINKAYGRTGSLFQHPFGRVPITSDRQFWNVIAYIHQNPQKHKFVDDFREWKYSSNGIILGETKTSVNRGEVLRWFGSKEDYLRLHTDWVSDAQAKWFAEDDID